MTYVFDLDGTIIDSTKRHYVLMEQILRSNGILVDEDFASSYMDYKASGKSGKSYLIEILGIDKDKATEIQNEWIRHIEDDSMLALDELYDDALPTLSKINDSIMFLTIRDNSEGLKESLTRLGIDNYDIKILPHGESKTSVLEQIADHIIMIGDTEIDYKAAQEAGCEFYILNRGFRNESFWNDLGVDSHKDLSDLI